MAIVSEWTHGDYYGSNIIDIKTLRVPNGRVVLDDSNNVKHKNYS